jgi:HEXXH motif-containing protein
MAIDIHSSILSVAATDCGRTAEPWLLIPDLMGGVRGSTSLTESVRKLPSSVRVKLGRRGLVARCRAVQDDVALEAAEGLIRNVSDLFTRVHSLVKGLFILEVSDPCYDQSHSEPSYPGCIFVSLPPAGPLASLRLAEAIIHEAMHLGLTALEERVPLVSGECVLHSPWKEESRPPSGVLHGVYVFACIRRFLQIVSIQVRGRPALHVRNRLKEIRSEAASIDWDTLAASLTPEGRCLLSQLRLVCGC